MLTGSSGCVHLAFGCFLAHSSLQSERQPALSFSDILEDIREECQKYGPVVSLLIPKENPGKGQVSEWREEAVRSFSWSLCVLQDCFLSS